MIKRERAIESGIAYIRCILFCDATRFIIYTDNVYTALYISLTNAIDAKHWFCSKRD